MKTRIKAVSGQNTFFDKETMFQIFEETTFSSRQLKKWVSARDFASPIILHFLSIPPE